MPAVARLESTLAFNDTNFTQGIERAEKRAQTFAGRVEAQFMGLFRRAPGRKAEKALTGFITDLATGGVSQGIFSLASRFTGLGLAAGVGVGVAVELFGKLHDQIKTVKTDSESLRLEMLKPISLIGGLSPEGIDQQAAVLKTKYDKIIDDHKGFMQTLTNLFRDQDVNADFGTTGIKDTRQEQEALDRIHQIQRERGRVEVELAQAKRTDRGDETKTALDEVYFKSRQAEAAIRIEGGKGVSDRLKAVKIEEERLTDEIVHRNEVREQEFKTAEKLLKLERSGIPEDKKKVLAAAIGLDVVNKSLENPDITTGERRALTLDKLRKENELRSLSGGKRNPFAFGTTANRKFEEDQGGFGTLAGRNRDTNDPNVFGSLANSAMNRGESPLSAQTALDQQMLQELQALRTLTEKVWATP